MESGERTERPAATDLRERYEAAGQGHVFAFWRRLDAAGRARLSAQLTALDLALVGELAALLEAGPPVPTGAFEPPELFPLRRDADDEARARAARERGAELLARGAVGYLLVAGGQASRLGYDGPKGCFPVGPVSGRSLFAIHARRLRAAAARHGAPTPFYVMTSPANDAATRAFFGQNEHFGLDPRDVRFFAQAMLPALDPQGRILMAAPDSLFLAPDGHGGVLAALADSGCLAAARARGVETISYFQVDNPLVRPADPLFLGLHAAAGARMSSKVVEKRDPAEKVGVIGRADGRLGCIEYSDLPAELREAREPTGELTFRAGNIAVHALQVDFVQAITRDGLRLPWHLARKKVAALDDDGRPTEREGIKFEAFVFDALGLSPTSVTLEVERAHEFSPVKNASGVDSPASARRDLCALFAGWARRAGRELPDADADGVHPVEVDPLVAEDEADFLARAPAAPVVRPEGHLYE